jgi:hypothetical protein
VGTKASGLTKQRASGDSKRTANTEAALNTEVTEREGSIFKCALTHLKARAYTENQSDTPPSTRAMVVSWEKHKNNKRQGTTAITCYHKLDDIVDVGSIKQRKIMIDTGANVTLLRKENEPFITGAKNSTIRIEVADKRCISGSQDGTAHMHILQLSQEAVENSAKTAIETGFVLAHKITTVDDLSRELFSIDDMFVNGCSILLRAPEYENGIPEIHIPPTRTTPEFSIPLRYDYEQGGFWLDYVLHDPSDRECSNLRAASEIWEHQRTSTALMQSMPRISETQAAAMTCALQESEAVKQVEFVFEQSITNQAFGAGAVSFGQHPEAGITNIRGVKMGLKSSKRQIKATDFHDDHGHLGCVGKCIVCALASGCARGITQVVDRYNEVRRAHTWDGDILTWEHRSEAKSKYQIVLRDRMSKAFKFL